MRTSNAKNHKRSAKGSIFLKTTVQSFAPLEVITLYDTGSANNIKWKNMLSCVYIYIFRCSSYNQVLTKLDSHNWIEQKTTSAYRTRRNSARQIIRPLRPLGNRTKKIYLAKPCNLLRNVVDTVMWKPQNRVADSNMWLMEPRG